MHFNGLLLGLTAFVCIGCFHPIVIKAEYYFSHKIWPVFLVAGLVFLGISLMICDPIFSSIIGVIGFSCFWSILELFQQNKRVEKGWFPDNPNRKSKKK